MKHLIIFMLIILGIKCYSQNEDNVPVKLCCATKQQEIPAEHQNASISTETKIKEIVLVNAGESDRCQMGELVQRISKCNPRVVGINFLFIEEKDVNCDSTLRTSIIDSDKVVLVEAFENGNSFFDRVEGINPERRWNYKSVLPID